ncbi:MAG: SH3 domain-containing protein [Chloroflexota bacterium]|nr:SH3 domain-containing protein [Chloroflexota bacterium]
MTGWRQWGELVISGVVGIMLGILVILTMGGFDRGAALPGAGIAIATTRASPTATLFTPTPRSPTPTVAMTPTPVPSPLVPPTPVASPTPAPTVITSTVITSGANVRSSPERGDNVIGSVRRGDELILLGILDDWYLVRLGARTAAGSTIRGGQGWVARSVVSEPSRMPPLITPTVEH